MPIHVSPEAGVGLWAITSPPSQDCGTSPHQRSGPPLHRHVAQGCCQTPGRVTLDHMLTSLGETMPTYRTHVTITCSRHWGDHACIGDSRHDDVLPSLRRPCLPRETIPAPAQRTHITMTCSRHLRDYAYLGDSRHDHMLPSLGRPGPQGESLLFSAQHQPPSNAGPGLPTRAFQIH